MLTISSCLRLLLAVSEFGAGENAMSSDQGLKIYYNRGSYNDTQKNIVQGTFSTFVSCGSQYATWRQFPQAIRYSLKDLDSGAVYNSINMELSISEYGDETYEFYRNEPCGIVVSKDFSVSLNDIYFQESPKTKIINFELQAEYAGHTSNLLTLKQTSFYTKSL